MILGVRVRVGAGSDGGSACNGSGRRRLSIVFRYSGQGRGNCRCIDRCVDRCVGRCVGRCVSRVDDSQNVGVGDSVGISNRIGSCSGCDCYRNGPER